MGKQYLSVEVGPAANEHESAPRRNYKAAKGPWTYPPGKPNIKTVYDLFLDGVKTYSSLQYMGQRKTIKIHYDEKVITKIVNGEKEEQKRKWQYFEMGPYTWQTFKEVKQASDNIASGLVHLGMKPGVDRFHIYCMSCADWMQTFLALTTQNITCVTAYDTLGEEGLVSSIQETETVGILADRSHFSTLLKVLPNAPSIRLIIYRDFDGPLSEEDLKKVDELKKLRDLKVYSLSEVKELGAKNPAKPTPPTAEDTACIMYTSGSVGKPKGVILKHSTIIAGVTGATGNVNRECVSEKDVFLTILPLAHIFELTAELATLWWGAKMGYGTPKTVSEANMRNCKGDIRELRPTVLAAVPAVFEAVKKGIMGNIKKLSPTMQKIFWSSYRLKAKMDSWGLPTPLVNQVIFRKIKEATGGRMRFIMNGGAALSYESRVFMNTLIAPLVMGYGLTETNAMACLADPRHIDFDSCGELVTAVTIKLVDVPENNYFAKNGQGELYIKGPAVSPGYYNNDEENKKAFTEDGWFRTGDIGEWTKTGTIRLIDRRKNLVKTANGEYVALERLEALYRSNDYVLNICVFADDQHTRPVAVVVPNLAAVQQLCKDRNIEYHEGMVDDPAVYKQILKSIQNTGRENGLKSFELLGGLAFDEEWTPQNGFVTSAQKVQRRQIAEHNAEGLARAFKDA